MDVRIRVRYFDHRVNYRNRKKKKWIKNSSFLQFEWYFYPRCRSRELQDHIVVNEQFWHISSER